MSNPTNAEATVMYDIPVAVYQTAEAAMRQYDDTTSQAAAVVEAIAADLVALGRAQAAADITEAGRRAAAYDPDEHQQAYAAGFNDAARIASTQP